MILRKPAHKHASLMLQYANDASKYKNPWHLWEINYTANESGFRSCKMKDMVFYPHREYRRKSNETNE